MDRDRVQPWIGVAARYRRVRVVPDRNRLCGVVAHHQRELEVGRQLEVGRVQLRDVGDRQVALALIEKLQVEGSRGAKTDVAEVSGVQDREIEIRARN